MGKGIESISRGSRRDTFGIVSNTKKFTEQRTTRVVYVPQGSSKDIDPSRITALPGDKPTVEKPQETATPAKLSPEAERQKRLKNLVSDTIVALGLILLAVGVCVVAAHALGGLTMESNQLQTIIMCGFGLIAGGLSLPNTDYKGSLNLAAGPFVFNVVPKQ